MTIPYQKMLCPGCRSKMSSFLFEGGQNIIQFVCGTWISEDPDSHSPRSQTGLCKYNIRNGTTSESPELVPHKIIKYHDWVYDGY